MPDRRWWAALWPDPAATLRAIGIEAGMHVLDLCCGDGYFTAALAALVNGEVTALDYDAALLEQARAEAERQGVSVRRWLCADARDMDRLLDEPVDYVLMANTFHGVPDPTALLASIRRVLRSSARLGLINWHPLERERTPVLGQARGPATRMRLGVTRTRSLVEGAGFYTERVVELPPYHYGIVFVKDG